MGIRLIKQTIEHVVSKLSEYMSLLRDEAYPKRSYSIDTVINGIKIDQDTIEGIVPNLKGKHYSIQDMEIGKGGILIGEVNNNTLEVKGVYVPENSLGISINLHNKKIKNYVKELAKMGLVWGYVEYWPYKPTPYEPDNEDTYWVFDTTSNQTVRRLLSKEFKIPEIGIAITKDKKPIVFPIDQYEASQNQFGSYFFQKKGIQEN